MPRAALCGNARGLRQTARNMINAGTGSQAALSIARSATENLINTAKWLGCGNPAVASLEVHDAITWAEIHAIANVIINACCEAGPIR